MNKLIHQFKGELGAIFLKIAFVELIVEGLIMYAIMPVIDPYIDSSISNLMDPIILILVTGPIISFWIIGPYVEKRDLFVDKANQLKEKADLEHREKEFILSNQTLLLEQAVANATLDLTASRERYEMVEKATNDGLWDWYSHTNQAYYSPRFKEIMGYKDNEFPNDSQAWFAQIHQEDKNLVKQIIKAASKSKDGSTGEFVYRCYHKDGRILWLQARWIKVKTNEGVRLAGALTDVTERKKMEDDLIYASLHDTLTGLPNRRLFQERLEQALLRFKRSPAQKFAVLFIDVDNFKRLNDSLGHNAGDKVLGVIAQRLKSVFREIDTVARFGGDEFAVLITGMDSRHQLKSTISRMIATVREPTHLGSSKITPSISVGAVVSSQHHKDATPDKILMDADIALYKTKEKQRGTCSFFTLPMRTKVEQQFEIENSLRNSFHKGDVFLHYQPIVDANSHEIAGFEALMRLRHPRYGMISPDIFIPVAEESELINELGNYVIDEATKQLVRWCQLTNKNDLIMSINVSGRQFQTVDVAARVKEAYLKYGALPKNIQVEMTETVLATGFGMVQKNIDKLAEMGVLLALDDFGAGYSSLGTLSKYPFNTLKIDKAFVDDMVNDRLSRNMIEIIETIARARNMITVAEGAETQEQVQLLANLGCQKIQGFYFSKGLPADELDDLLSKSLYPTAWRDGEQLQRMVY